MRIANFLFCIVTAFSLAVQAGSVCADELVHFESAPVKASAFRERIEKEQGTLPLEAQGTQLLGYLSRPQGNGPFPAVVLMHGCSGIRKNVKEIWPERLVAWGYVVLVVDSFTTRNIKDTCQSYLPDRVFDAFGALDYLSKSSFVDAGHIALMGFSAGGIATLEATKANGNEQFMDRKFKAAVAYYPVCAARAGDATVPTLILNGDLDDWSPAEPCRQRVAHQTGNGAPIELNIYAGAYHDFDASDLVVPKRTLGHLEEYNALAAEQSIRSVRAFLQKYLSN